MLLYVYHKNDESAVIAKIMLSFVTFSSLLFIQLHGNETNETVVTSRDFIFISTKSFFIHVIYYEISNELFKIKPMKVRQMHERDLAIKEASLIKDNLNVEISTLRQELQLSLEEVRNKSLAYTNFAMQFSGETKSRE